MAAIMLEISSGMFRLSILANLDNFLSLLLEGWHGAPSTAFGSWSSVSRDRAREPWTEDIFKPERLPSLFRKARPVSERIGRNGLCLLSNAQSCSSAGGDRISAVIPIHARAATILHAVF